MQQKYYAVIRVHTKRRFQDIKLITIHKNIIDAMHSMLYIIKRTSKKRDKKIMKSDRRIEIWSRTKRKRKKIKAIFQICSFRMNNTIVRRRSSSELMRIEDLVSESESISHREISMDDVQDTIMDVAKIGLNFVKAVL